MTDGVETRVSTIIVAFHHFEFQLIQFKLEPEASRRAFKLHLKLVNYCVPSIDFRSNSIERAPSKTFYNCPELQKNSLIKNTFSRGGRRKENTRVSFSLIYSIVSHRKSDLGSLNLPFPLVKYLLEMKYIFRRRAEYLRLSEANISQFNYSKFLEFNTYT